MLAQAAHALLPPPSLTEQIEITKLHALITNLTALATARPFRAPHHTASIGALLGGGPNLIPGEIPLAHRGILFLDELPEFSRDCIEALRLPLEDRLVHLNRLGTHITYPADFTLIATMNPCPCGYFGSAVHSCSCSLSQVEAYHRKLSGPILDRIDLQLQVQPVDNSVLLKNTTISTTEHVSAKTAILAARARQLARYGDARFTNANLSSYRVTQQLQLTGAARALLASASDHYHLSARSYFKIIKVAQTIADLAASPTISDAHIAEALQYRLPQD